MKFTAIVVFCVGLLLWGCEKESSYRSKGDVYVTVYNGSGYYQSPVEGANVFTVPATKQGVTDEFGTVLLKDIDPDSYEFYASLDGYGSGKAVVQVLGDSLKKVSIYVIEGVTNGFTPRIELVLPSNPANFAFGENVVFSFSVVDEDSPNDELNVEISSDLDGVLLQAHPDVNNNVKFETSKLSRGIHKMSVKATDADKYSTILTFDLSTVAPVNVKLESATTDGNWVTLKWEKYSADDFNRYEILRATDKDDVGLVLASYSAVETIEFIDKTPPLATEAYYYVRVTNKEGYTRNSNRIKVDAPAGAIYYFSVSDAVHHPTEPILFLVDYSALKLRAINYVTQKEVNNLNLSGTVGKIDVADNGYGLEIYVPNNSGFIHVYNASTFDLVTTITTGLPTECVRTNGHGYVAASVTPSPWWENPVRTYSRSTGMMISGNGDFEGDYMRFIPNTDKIISITTGISPVDMEYFELDNTGKILLHQDDSYHGDHPLDPNIFRISTNGEFVVTANLGAVYSASKTMVYKGLIDRGALYFSDFAFSKDGNVIYAGTSNRKSLQIVNYPALTRTNEILTKGYPKYLFNFNNEIIAISKTDTNSESFAIERIKPE